MKSDLALIGFVMQVLKIRQGPTPFDRYRFLRGFPFAPPQGPDACQIGIEIRERRTIYDPRVVWRNWNPCWFMIVVPLERSQILQRPGITKTEGFKSCRQMVCQERQNSMLCGDSFMTADIGEPNITP